MLLLLLLLFLSFSSSLSRSPSPIPHSRGWGRRVAAGTQWLVEARAERVHNFPSRPVESVHSILWWLRCHTNWTWWVKVEWGWRSSIHFSSWLCIVCRGWGQAEASSTFLSICSADSASGASFSLSSSLAQFSCWVNFTVLFKSVESGSLGLSCKVSFSRLLFCTAWFSTLTCSHEPFQPWKFV